MGVSVGIETAMEGMLPLTVVTVAMEGGTWTSACTLAGVSRAFLYEDSTEKVVPSPVQLVQRQELSPLVHA